MRGRRPYQEDVVYCSFDKCPQDGREVGCFGVFDGERGAWVLPDRPHAAPGLGKVILLRQRAGGRAGVHVVLRGARREAAVLPPAAGEWLAN